MFPKTLMVRSGIFLLDKESRDLMPCFPKDISSVTGTLGRLDQEQLAEVIIKASKEFTLIDNSWCGISLGKLKENYAFSHASQLSGLKDTIQTMVCDKLLVRRWHYFYRVICPTTALIRKIVANKKPEKHIRS